MTLDQKTVVLRGPAGRLGRPDNKNTGVWGSSGKGFRGVIWDGTDPHDARYQHTAIAVENKNYQIINKQTGGMMGADATGYSGSIPLQFYYKPDGDTDRGGYETWRVYDGNENGAIQAQIEYDAERGKYFSASVAVEVVE
jgi:glutamine amidotransferase-like uncharacterized protein